MPLCIVNVAYPFAPVTADPIGGAEQVLSQLDSALVSAGWISIVVAAVGSSTCGLLVSVSQPHGEINDSERSVAHIEVRHLIRQVIDRYRPDVVHLHGFDFHEYLPTGKVPVLVTLHLPLNWYPLRVLESPPSGVWLAPVSKDQTRRGPLSAQLLPPIENGIDLGGFPRCRKQSFALALGRICPEKGFHLALDAAKAAGMPMLLAGRVFPYAAHRRYFEQEIAPRLDRSRRWIGPITGWAKRKLLAQACCVVAPSLAPETSCLVACEALAAGTPVVALSTGALIDVIEDGCTGFLVDTPNDLPSAMLHARVLDAEQCRSAAYLRFSRERMIKGYFAAYRQLAAGQARNAPRMQVVADG